MLFHFRSDKHWISAFKFLSNVSNCSNLGIFDVPKKKNLNVSCVERYLWSVLIALNFVCFIDQTIHVIYKISSLATYSDKFAQN